MPGRRFSRKVNTPKKSRQWDHVYRSALSRGDSKGVAIRKASGTVKKSSRKRRRASPRR